MTLPPNQVHCLLCGTRYVELVTSCALCASRGSQDDALDLLHVTNEPVGLADGRDADYALRDRHGRQVRWEYTVTAEGDLLHSDDVQPALYEHPAEVTGLTATTDDDVVLRTVETEQGILVHALDQNVLPGFTDTVRESTPHTLILADGRTMRPVGRDETIKAGVAYRIIGGDFDGDEDFFAIDQESGDHVDLDPGERDFGLQFYVYHEETPS